MPRYLGRTGCGLVEWRIYPWPAVLLRTTVSPFKYRAVRNAYALDVEEITRCNYAASLLWSWSHRF